MTSTVNNSVGARDPAWGLRAQPWELLVLQSNSKGLGLGLGI